MQTTATLNPILTTFANQFMRDPKGFVADRVYPHFMAPLQAGSYYVFAPGDIANVPALKPRAPGSHYPRLLTKVSSDSYACSDYGLEAPAPDEERKKYAAYFDLDKLKTNRIVDTVRINRELRTVAAVATAANAAVAIPWNDPSSQPKGDCDAASEVIRQQSGIPKSQLTLVISQPTMNSLETHPRLVDLFKYTTPGTMNPQKLAGFLGIKEVIVAFNIQATNNEGQVFTAADIWGNNAFLFFSTNQQDLEMPTFGRTFHWTAFTSLIDTSTGGSGPAMTAGGGGPDLMQIFTYRDETVKADIHRGEHYVVEKTVASGCGYLITNLLQ